MKRRLEDDVVVRGTVSASGGTAIAPPQPTVEHGVAMVTALPVKAGEAVTGGEVVAAVSDRPVFVLAGSVPLFRDIYPGDTGSDVAELQKALRAAGFSTTPDKSGHYGEGTQRAVKKMYAKAGYDPVEVAAAQPTPVSAKVTPTPATAPTASMSPPKPPKQAPIVPRSGVVMLPSLPARVASVDARVGQLDPKVLLHVNSGPLVIRCEVSSAASTGLKAGAKAVVDELPGGGGGPSAKVAATVGAVTTSNNPGEGGSSGGPVAVVVPDK